MEISGPHVHHSADWPGLVPVVVASFPEIMEAQKVRLKASPDSKNGKIDPTSQQEEMQLSGKGHRCRETGAELERL